MHLGQIIHYLESALPSKCKMKKIAISILVSFLAYVIISLTLIGWPAPQKRNVENYDYSSLDSLGKNRSNGEEHWLTLRDGSKLFYRHYASSTNSTLILIHGSGSESRYLENIASYISENGLANVITPDLRGHGRTSKVKGDIDFIGQYDNDLEDIVLSVKSQNPGGKIIIGGHSSGGGLALRYAGNPAVSDVDGFLLFAPYLGYDAPTVKPNSGNWVTVATKRFIGLAMMNNIGIRYFNDLPVLFFNLPENRNDEWQTPSYTYRLSMSFQPNNYKEAIKKIHHPALVLVGDKDESFYADQFQKVFKESALCEVKVIPGATHLDVLNNQESKKEITNWFNTLLGGPVEAVVPPPK